MPESRSHKAAKNRAAGKTGKTEVVTPDGRLDVRTRSKAVEIERSGDPRRIRHALEKLKKVRGLARELQVPAKDQPMAQEVAQEVSLTVTITNLNGDNPRRVSP